MEHSTIAAIATAPGAGGIAVVRLSGPESYAVAAKVFCPANPAKRVEDAKGYTALFGHFMEGEEAFDEGVALFFRAPHSYTGEDVVELSCHGGSAVARRLVESCIAAGAAPAAPGEYTRRAFLNGKLGLTQAEAVMDLISADGRQGAALANASLNGALAKKIGTEKGCPDRPAGPSDCLGGFPRGGRSRAGGCPADIHPDCREGRAGHPHPEL